MAPAHLLPYARQRARTLHLLALECRAQARRHILEIRSRGWTNADIAARLGVQRGRVMAWSRGYRSPRTHVLRQSLARLARQVVTSYPPTQRSFSGIGAVLMVARQALGVSYAELARRLGVSPQSLCDWSNGRGPNVPSLRRLLALTQELQLEKEFVDICERRLAEAPLRRSRFKRPARPSVRRLLQGS